ncbi:MAG: hypothetical protein Q7U99_14915 [Rubrivivax sp.]|nr:hypothetical protein [Rubrivivax sp.]
MKAAASALAGAASLAALPAGALEAPTGAVLLTLTGLLRKANHGTKAHFDMAMLEALPQLTHTTRTPWYAQSRRFTGPLLRDVLSAAGAHGSRLRLSALNDYQVDMPVDDAQRYDVIVARLLDDKPLGVRDKGPLFVMYPFDSRRELRTAVYYGRSVWQLRSIEVL